MSCQKIQLYSQLMGSVKKPDQVKGNFSTDLIVLQSLCRNFSSEEYFKMGLIFTEFSFHNSGHMPTRSPAFFLNNFLKSSVCFFFLKLENGKQFFDLYYPNSVMNMHPYSFSIYKCIIDLFEPMLLAMQATSTHNSNPSGFSVKQNLQVKLY